MHLGSLYNRCIKKLKSLKPQLEAQILIQHVTNYTYEKIIAYPETPVSDTDTNVIKTLIDRRNLGEPIAYITKTKEFYGMDFFVNSCVLIPRPETELLVETALTVMENFDNNRSQNHCTHHLLDCGTGSGCIGIVLAAEHKRKNNYKTNLWNITLSDIDYKCIEVAKQNIKKNLDADTNIDVQLGNLLEPVKHSSKTFDIVTANLPYLSPHEYKMAHLPYEPPLALIGSYKDTHNTFYNGSQNGMAYIYSLILHTSNWTHKHCILLEADPLQTDTIIKTAASCAYEHVKLHRDFRGCVRVFELHKNIY